VTDLMRSTSDVTLFPVAQFSPSGTHAVVRPRAPWQRLFHPLAAICALQAGLSLTLVWSNTAFTDEAEYLWGGHLQISHWLHGTPLPSTLTHTFSGSPIIYPPIGAVADSIGGLAGARILSLMFMLIATVLLYSVAKELMGNVAALFASAVWAISEPTMRLGAFATYDALSILLTAISVWLAVQAGRRRYRGELVAASAATLALANATAYSGIVIDPVVIALAFLVWLPAMGARQARFCAAWLVGAYAAFFALIVTLSQSWSGFMFTIIFRGTASGFVDNRSTITLILGSVWAYSGFCIVMAAIGSVTALFAETGSRRVVPVLLGCAALVIPAAQTYNFTAVSLDKHLDYGIWFAAMAAGYGCSKLLQSVPTRRLIPAILCCVLALAYPAADGWQAAWYKQVGWSNASSFVAAFKLAAARARGPIDATTQSYVAMYYSPEGHDWSRWNRTAIPLDPSGVPKAGWGAFYSQLLNRTNYGVIALFYTTTVRGLPTRLILSTQHSIAREQLLNVIAANTGSSVSPMQGLPTLTSVLERDSAYSLAAVGPYSTITISGVYALWQRKPTK
jgi:hypothetical protein